MRFQNHEFQVPKGTHCMAEYQEQVVPENRGNPFIEALPKKLNNSEFFDCLYSVPKFKEEQLELDVIDRLELVRQIKPSFWLPMPEHYNKYLNLYSMLKIGFQSRNPLAAMYNKQFAIGWDKIFESGINSNGENLAGNIHTAQSVAEIGLSGMGKSKIYERMLTNLFPQVIHHREYKGRKLPMTQVVWIKIECPSDKSIAALCKNFYSEVDDILNTNFYEKYGEKKGTIQDQAKRMVKVAASINLGVLVIDEIQKIKRAYSGGDERMVEFITEIVNTLGVPVILIGTFKAMYLFKNSLANTRRGIPDEFTENITGYMLEDQWEWEQFIKCLWDLQNTRTFTELDDELKRAMYFHSMGIPDIANKLFMHVQSQAIVNGGDERITVSLIEKVANRSLKLLQPIFQKIRRGDSEALQKFDDVEPDWLTFNEYLKEAEHNVNVYGRTAQDHKRMLQKREKEGVLSELIKFATNLSSDMPLIQALANQVYNANNDNGDLTSLFAQLAQLIHASTKHENSNIKEDNGNAKKNKKLSKKDPLLENDDPRYIVQEGLKRGLTTEETLYEANLIRDCEELLEYV